MPRAFVNEILASTHGNIARINIIGDYNSNCTLFKPCSLWEERFILFNYYVYNTVTSSFNGPFPIPTVKKPLKIVA